MTAPTSEDRPLVMGILNVTPDSFSDGGRWFGTDQAVARGRQMIAEGADIVDVGGESTRPGAEPVEVDEEVRRVVPVIEALVGDVRISVDTTKEAVAEAAVDAGATLVNDVSASLWPVAARRQVGWVAMHRKGHAGHHAGRSPLSGRGPGGHATSWWSGPRTPPGAGSMRCGSTRASASARRSPTTSSSWPPPPTLVATGYPVMVGTSRKRFIGVLTARDGDEPDPVDERLPGSLATATWAMQSGAQMVRVHDVAPYGAGRHPGGAPSRATRGDRP